jgi:hypothetical protein
LVEARAVTIGDLERAIAIRDPQLGDLLVRYLEQEDPNPGHSELPAAGRDDLWTAADGEAAADAEDAEAEVEVPAGAFTIYRLKQGLQGHEWQNKNATEKKLTRRDLFSSAEISPFARAFAAAAASVSGRAAPEILADAHALLLDHDFPGNVRELKNVIERAVIVSGGGPISSANLLLGPSAHKDAPGSALRDSVAQAERARIIAALAEADGNQSRAAASLGISRRTLINKLDEYALPRPRKGR